MCHIIALALQKGGVGKTTTTAALGMELAASGSRVLCVDLDPQGNLTQALGIQLGGNDLTVYEALIDPAMTTHAIVKTEFGVDLLPATLRLAGAELRFASQIARETLLRDALIPVRPDYDVILIDSPPSLGLFTVNVLAAADTVLVPLQAHIYALGAMEQLKVYVCKGDLPDEDHQTPQLPHREGCDHYHQLPARSPDGCGPLVD